MVPYTMMVQLLPVVTIVTILRGVQAQPPHPVMCPTHHRNATCVLPDPCCTPFVESGCAGAAKGEAWCSKTLSHKARAAAAVAAMTLTEKIANTGMPTSPLWDDRWNLRLLPGSSRLGIPSTLFGEIAHGVASPADPAQCLNGGLHCSTSFPATPVLAASFDRALWRAVGAAAGLEGRAWGNAGRNLMGTLGWAPNINGFRDPRWGRGQETPGEDVHLSGAYAEQFITGLQNGSADAPPQEFYQIISTAKHFIGYDMDGGNSNISDRWAAEYYLPQFENAVRAGNVREIMTAHVAVNGVRMAANRFYNEHVAREAWGFTGLFTSDCGDVSGICHGRGVTCRDSTPGGICQAALEQGGLSVNCGGYLPTHLAAAVKDGKVSEALIDAALTRTFEAGLSLGSFDTPNARTAVPAAAIDSPQHRRLALQAAQDGIVLLKNHRGGGALPLRQGNSVALIGPAANATFVMQSNYQGYSRLILENSPLLAMQRRGGAKVKYSLGCEYAGDNATKEKTISAAVSAAQSADAAVVVVGITPDGSGSSNKDPNGYETEGHNRDGIVLPGAQVELIRRVAAANKRTIVVFIHGGAVTMPTDVAVSVAAVVDANYPGQAGGEAIASLLYGEYSPSGRLPYTIYQSSFAKQRPDPTDHALDSPPFGLTYMYWRGDEPLCSFGQGLTYSQFQHEFVLPMQREVIGDDATSVPVQMRVSRAAGHDDHETARFSVLIFSTYHGSTHHGSTQGLSEPKSKLVAFAKTRSLWRGESQLLTLHVSLMRGLALVDQDGAYVLRSGEYSLTSPASSGLVADDRRATLHLSAGDGDGDGDGAIKEDRYLPEARLRFKSDDGVLLSSLLLAIGARSVGAISNQEPVHLWKCDERSERQLWSLRNRNQPNGTVQIQLSTPFMGKTGDPSVGATLMLNAGPGLTTDSDPRGHSGPDGNHANITGPAVAFACPGPNCGRGDNSGCWGCDSTSQFWTKTEVTTSSDGAITLSTTNHGQRQCLRAPPSCAQADLGVVWCQPILSADCDAGSPAGAQLRWLFKPVANALPGGGSALLIESVAHPGWCLDTNTMWSNAACASALTKDMPFCNPALPTHQRAADLVGRLTPQERLAQLSTNAPAVPRLGLGMYQYWGEGLHGVIGPGTTVFPQVIGLAASFNRSLFRAVGYTISTELRATLNAHACTEGAAQRCSGLSLFAPNVNIYRDPRWGRGHETPGEDPYLNTEYAAHLVSGMQGHPDDPVYDSKWLKAIATCKHYDAYSLENFNNQAAPSAGQPICSGPDCDRTHFNAIVSEQELAETYLPAFGQGCVEGGDARSVMCSYNAGKRVLHMRSAPLCGSCY